MLTMLCIAVSGCIAATEPKLVTPDTLEAITPTGLTATVGTAVLPAPTVMVRDSNGRPRAGVEVQFEFRYLTDVDKTTSRTGPDGRTSAPWVLGRTAGVGSATAHVAGSADIVFRATGVAGPIALIEPVGGNDQFGLSGTTAGPLSARVLDAYRNPIAGATVVFRVTKGGGRITTNGIITGMNGNATSGPWMLGEAGANLVEASAGTVSTTLFTATAVTPGAGAVDAVYTLVSIDGHPTEAVTESISLTARGKFTTISEFRWNGNTTIFSSAGEYAIAGPRLLFNVEAGGQWIMGAMTGDLGLASPTLELSVWVDGPDYFSTRIYQRKP